MTRWPAVTAGELGLLQWASGGRAFFCLGTGGGSSSACFEQMGQPQARLAEVREYGLAVKALCAGESAMYRGHSLKSWREGTFVPVPLYLDASGPRAMQLAGEIADGVVSAYGISRDAVQGMHEQLAIGAESAGRSSAGLDVWHVQPLLVAPTYEEAIERLSFYLAMRVKSIFSYPERKGVPEELHEPIRRFREAYSATTHGDPASRANADALERHGIAKWAAERQAIAGPPEQIVERLVEIASYGVRNIMFPLWGSIADRLSVARTLADKVLPHL